MRLPLGRRRPAPPADEDLTARWIESAVADAFEADQDALARVRARILLAHRVAATEAAAELAAAAQDRRGRLGFGRSRVGRRGAAIGFALVAVVAMSGVAAAQSGPGQPFYDVRLAVETATLPPAGTPAGVQARLRLLQERLGELESATSRKDERAAAAALHAYRSRLAQLFPAGSPEPIDLGIVAVPGVDLPAVGDRLSGDSSVLEHVQPNLAPADATTATGVIVEVDRIRAAIADRVARDDAAHDNAGSGNGLGPRASAKPGSSAAPGATHGSGSSHRPEKRKGGPNATASPSPTAGR